MSITRRKGLIAFLVIIGVIFAGVLFWVDPLAKRTIEAYGTKRVGAKVEIDDVNVSFFPFSITLLRLQVINPKEPMRNLIELACVTFPLDVLELFGGKVIIQNMTVNGVRLDISGAIAGQVETADIFKGEEKKAEIELPSLKVSNVQEILSQEELKSLKLAESIYNDGKIKKEGWEKRVKGLMSDQKYDDYKQRIKQFKSGGRLDVKKLLASFDDLKKIQKEVVSDIRNIKDAEKEFKKDIISLKDKLKQVKPLVKEDAAYLKGKYGLSSEGLSNMSDMLFGEEVGKWTKTVFCRYADLKPFLMKSERGSREKPFGEKGLNEYKALPDFLIRTLTVSGIETDIGVLNGQVRNITGDQDILGLPLTFDFSGDKIKDIKINGVLDHIVAENPKDTLNLSVKEYKLKDIKLSDSEKLSVKLQEGLLDLELQVVLKGNVLSANLSAGVKAAKFLVAGQGENKPAIDLIASVLADLSSINMEGEIIGTPTDYDLKLKSNLDDILKEAVKKVVREQSGQLEKEIEGAIAQKLKIPVGEAEILLEGLSGLENNLPEYINKLSNLL